MLHLLPLLCQTQLSDGEITFAKFLGLLLMILWAVYLVREIFFAHRPDPRVDAMTQAIAQMAATTATVTTRMDAMERRQGELIAQQREDTARLFDRVETLGQSLSEVLREHERELSRRPQ